MVESVSLLGVAKVLKKPLDDLYESGKAKYKLELQKWQSNAAINALHKKISSVQKVKTIWQIDKETNIKAFYYPSKVLLDDSAHTISQLDKLPLETNIVIQGTVGQGKSIFLRYLCGQELKIGARIPVFCELRRIDEKTSVKDLIWTTLNSWDFDINDGLFDFFAKSGKFVFLLDGFDEIRTEFVQKVISELENWSEKYEQIKIVVTSRPDSGIERSRFFRIVKLAPLSQDDHAGIICKLVPNKSQQALLIDAISASSTDIKSLLTTPLMITLLVLVYKSTQKIPEQFSEFYENLFHTLLVKHDRSKPGYTRERKCKINERKLQEIFEAFCFLSSKSGLTSIKFETMHKLSGEAVSAVNIACDTGEFIHDVTKICCLVIEEAFEYHFIHKSVREFHAANFIKNRNEEFAKKLYKSLLSRHESWIQELNFLSQIDKYRFSVYFLKPHIEMVAEHYGIDLLNMQKINRLSIENEFGGWCVSFEKNNELAPTGFRSMERYLRSFNFMYDPWNYLLDEVFKVWIRYGDKNRKLVISELADHEGWVEFVSLINRLDCRDKVIKRCIRQMEYFIETYQDLLEYIRLEENKIKVLDVLN